MNTFMSFSVNAQAAFDDDENKYLGFSQLLKDTSKGIFQAGITKADADKKIKEQFRTLIGVDEKASKKEVRRAVERNKHEIFEVVEDVVEDMLTSGWGENPFFQEFVEIRNLALEETNEFRTEDKTVLSVGRLNGNHWDIDRQRLGVGDTFRVPTYWVGLGIYEEFEAVAAGYSDWARLTSKIYEAMDDYVNGIVYQSVMAAGSQVLPGSDQFYKTSALTEATKSVLITMIEDVQAANRGAEVVIMGTKTALSKLNDVIPIAWISKEDRTDRRNLGYVGVWEGVRTVEIPQVFKKNDTTTKMVDPNVLLVMPVADNRFIKLVYEGDSRIKEVTDSTEHNDMTYDFKYMTKLGVSTIIGRYFGTFNIVI